MYLKRLEIHGFKSFADKVTLDFRQGLSVIVGPNGSGKSNVADGIRWVLGEQSVKSLRGAKMEDVIFAGSTKRRAVGMAEVCLTLDNSTGIFPLAYSEITVTRRVYRSGESEYLINKTPCRLKDIHELFMDTGIGKEGFSIIGQGRVEEILSSKPEDRRGLIEEVAGITKYRNRKREAARKLEETEQNLLRLHDIVHELESQLEPLREQAEKARLYKGFKEQLDQLEINLAVHDIADLSSKLEQCRSQIAGLKDKVVESEAGLCGLEARIAELKLMIQGLDEQIYQAQSNCHNLASRIQQIESDIKLCSERTTALQEQQERLGIESEELQRKAAALQAEYAAEETKLLILRQTRKELEARLEAAERQLAGYSRELGSAEDQLEDMKADVFELLAMTAKINNELTALQQQEESWLYRQSSLEKAQSAKEAELVSIRQSEGELGGELARAREEINNLLYAFNQGSIELEEVLSLQQAHLEEEGRLKERFQDVRSRLKLLKDMQRDYEGYNRGVKEILQASQTGKLNGVAGVAAELIQVRPTLVTAVEAALGVNLQNLIVLNEASAKECISYLKSHRSGRATFLPLDVLKPAARGFDRRVLEAPGVLGVAADLVECKPEFRPAVEYLLGRILVVENLDEAVRVAKLGGYKLRIVTLEGELLSPGGSMTGGSLQQRSASLLTRQRDIAQLEESEGDWRRQLEKLQLEKQATAEKLESLNQAQSRSQAQIKELELNLAALETRRARLAQDEERIGRELEQFQPERKQIAAELERLQLQQAELNESRHKCLADQERLNQEIEAGQANLREQGNAREQLQAEITDLKVKIASLEQEEKSLRQALERYYQQKSEFQASLADRASATSELERRREEITQEAAALREELAGLAEMERLAQAGLVDLRDKRQSGLAELEEDEKKARVFRQEIQANTDLFHAAELKEARLDSDIGNALKRLEEDLGLNLDIARTRCQTITNRRETLSNINKLRNEIAELEPVNLGAIEEYKRIDERYGFLCSQRQDLLQAKDSLFNVIAEMDRIMAERFGATFALIKEQFVRVFEELFGGGKAELQLTEPENLLETGVEIIAQPPGKRLQHLSLLSGGEKALTAIALLFAMLKVKPSPFCVLDEIEAALDEVNVNRFAMYLKELTALNQFIVISHRKGTMETADILYGVTMEETGVSKLYSVKMSEEDLAG